MKECKVPETRRKILIEFDSRCIEENTPMFEEILQRRHEVIISFKQKKTKKNKNKMIKIFIIL
jgi:hypothetical protein